MTRKYVTISFISALGAFGLIHLVFSSSDPTATSWESAAPSSSLRFPS